MSANNRRIVDGFWDVLFDVVALGFFFWAIHRENFYAALFWGVLVLVFTINNAAARVVKAIRDTDRRADALAAVRRNKARGVA